MAAKEALFVAGAALALLAVNEAIERRSQIVDVIAEKDPQAGEVAQSLLELGAVARDGARDFIHGFMNPDETARREKPTAQRVRIITDEEAS